MAGRCGQALPQGAVAPGHRPGAGRKPTSLEELLRLLEAGRLYRSPGAAKPSPSAQRAGATTSALTGWGDGYTLDDLLAVLSGQKEHTPANKPSRRPPRPGSICWWTSRQNCRPGKVPGTPAGQGVQPQTDGADPQLPVRTRAAGLCRSGKKNSRGNGPLPCAVGQIKAAEKRMAEIAVLRPTSSTTPKPARPMWPRKAGYSRKFRQEHGGHFAPGKEAFNELNVKKLTTIKELQTEMPSVWRKRNGLRRVSASPCSHAGAADGQRPTWIVC